MKKPKRLTEKFTFRFKSTRHAYGFLLGLLHNQFDIEGCEDREVKYVYNQLKKQARP